MAEATPLPWPSIDQLPRELCRQFSESLDAVAESTPDASAKMAKFCRFVLESPVACSEKLDGTNVGKTREGMLLGRRLVIEPSAQSYQGCPLRPIRAAETEQCLDQLCKTLAPGSAVLKSALYGELCCNPGLYSYKDRQLPKTWQLFGAIVEFEDASAADKAAVQGRAQGLVCISEPESSSVRVCNNPALTKLFAQHGLPHIGTEVFPSLGDFVHEKRDFMTSESGEGLVLSVDMGRDTEAFKWKISRESQPGSIAQLAALISRLAKTAGHDASSLDPRLHTLLSDLYAVATHVDSEALAPPEQPAGKKKKGKDAPPRLLGVKAVQQGLASALTKFDSLDAAFAAGGREAIPGLVERLAREIAGDADLEMPAGEEERAAGEKEVEADVRRFVTAAFGQFSSQARRPE